jgi:hypothetical protein
MLMQRSAFADALTWLEIHGNAPDKLGFWLENGAADAGAGEPRPGRRRRRRGRRRPIFPSRKGPE